MAGALVTGAGRGLGLEIARELAARGLAVQLTDVDGEAAKGGAATIGGETWSSQLDVRDRQACRVAAAETAERAESLEVWVNNAGILATGRSWEHDEDEVRRMLEVNTIGTINGTIAALEPMRQAGRGHIVNVISLAGLVAAPGEVLYSASKHGAIAFSLGTGSDLKRSGIRDIHVSCVCPDGILTPMIENRLDDEDAVGSFSGQLLTAEEAAKETVAVLDRPRPVTAIPRWRGAYVRLFDNFPRLGLALMPLAMSSARRRQQRYKRKIESGRWPSR
jgi:short-subunit dehydrogenase